MGPSWGLKKPTPRPLRKVSTREVDTAEELGEAAGIIKEFAAAPALKA